MEGMMPELEFGDKQKPIGREKKGILESKTTYAKEC